MAANGTPDAGTSQVGVTRVDTLTITDGIMICLKDAGGEVLAVSRDGDRYLLLIADPQRVKILSQ